MFVAQLSAGGAHVSSDVFGMGIGVAGQSRIAIDALGDVVVFSGHHDGTMNLGGGALPKPGDYDVYAGKLTATHAHQWSKGFGSYTTDDAQRMAIDPQGNIILTGWFQGPIDFGGGMLTPSGRDAFLVKLAP